MSEVIDKYICDICGKRGPRPGHYWADNFCGGSVSVCEDGYNGGWKWEHLCPSCRAALVVAIKQAIVQRKAS